jgi:hypothetical protein
MVLPLSTAESESKNDGKASFCLIHLKDKEKRKREERGRGRKEGKKEGRKRQTEKERGRKTVNSLSKHFFSWDFVQCKVVNQRGKVSKFQAQQS